MSVILQSNPGFNKGASDLLLPRVFSET